MIRRIAMAVGALVFGACALAYADPGQSDLGCGDHIHVKGHVRDQRGGGVSGAAPAWGEGSGMATGRRSDLPFLQGLPSGCVCDMRMAPTGGDGSYDLKIEVASDPRCMSAVDRITVDKTKLFWRKQGMTIVPAP